MSNKHIAINWAIKTVKQSTGFVYSDQFFRPFSNIETRKKISRVLLINNVVVWPDPVEGAFLFKKNDSRLKIITDGGHQGAVWQEGSNVMVLPTKHI